MNAIAAYPADWFVDRVAPYPPRIPPTITSEMQVPVAPAMRRARRPTLSMKNSAGRVLRQLTIPYTPVARSEVVLPSIPSMPKIVGA